MSLFFPVYIIVINRPKLTKIKFQVYQLYTFKKTLIPLNLKRVLENVRWLVL